MNMFRNRRKAKEQSDTLDALTGTPNVPSTYRTVKSLKRKNKTVPEEKPTFDLTGALPDDSSLRTSLLMPNLSARFSMLREQDDPNTKVGKAMDDSVLFPKRASRMNVFNHTPLSDVAEVESIYSSFRPPFADRERSSSFGDGYDSDSGSMMSRSRPGEGNNLFGGRQKLYRIPTSSTRNLNESESTVNGRYLYEHDVAMSQFQQYRIREKEARSNSEQDRTSGAVVDADGSEIASPVTAFSKNRGTQSSTNSAPRRISTAATSVASESPVCRDSAADSIATRTTDSMIRDSNSSLPVSKTRDDGASNRFASPSKRTNKSQRPAPIYSLASIRTTSSPSPITQPPTQPLDFGFKAESRAASATGRYQTGSPVPVQTQDAENVLANNVQPNDRGKATALGLFNKPAKEFDEHQFTQRQIQMHEDQISYMSNGSRSTSRASNDVQRARANSNIGITTPSPAFDIRPSAPQIPPVPNVRASPILSSNRASKASGRSTPPRPRSKSSAAATSAANVKARVESMIRKQNAELAALEVEKLGSPDLSENKENYPEAFFDNDDEESDYEQSSNMDSSRINSSGVDESEIHPAFRNSHRASNAFSRKSNYSHFSRTRSIVVDDDQQDRTKARVPTVDSEDIQEHNNLGLSGLIRTHFRQNSDKSSILPRPESGLLPSTTEQSRRESAISVSKPTADTARSDLLDIDLNHTAHFSQLPPTPTTAMSQAAERFLSQAMAIRDAAEQENEAGSDEQSWHDDLEPKHRRGESSETTKERREFDEELAARRSKIREGLKSVTERDRSQSPATAQGRQVVGLQAFVQQRAVTDPQPKAMKMLGLQSANSRSDEARGRKLSLRGDNRGGAIENGFHNTKHTATYARFAETKFEEHSEKQYPRRSATPPAVRYGKGERSQSATGQRSKTRAYQAEISPPVPSPRDYFATWNQPSPSPNDEPSNNLDITLGEKSNPRNVRSPTTEVHTSVPLRPSPKPSPISPPNASEANSELGATTLGAIPTGRTTPGSGRATPTGLFNRKRSVTKPMISEPTFVSSTSSVPLVHLPSVQNPTSAPPVPVMNPRRRGNTTGEKPIISPIAVGFNGSTRLETVPASPLVTDFGTEAHGNKSPSPRKLRKANSEGGSMAAKAKQQAMATELAFEKGRTPTLPKFPHFNKSTTSLVSTREGTMF